ncbi:hypothetical protein Hanom_Chr17g01578431 [Helianthus anomalus]
MHVFVYINRVIVVDLCAHAMIIMLQVHMLSSESGLSNDHDPMAVVFDDEIAPEPEVFTSDTESDPEMMSDDEDDFQPFALPDFGDDAPIADGIPIDDIFCGDGEVDDVVVLDIPPPAIPVIDISSDSSLHSVVDSFESVTSSALRAEGLQLYATDDDDAMSVAPSSPVRAPTPPHFPERIPDPIPVPFGILDIAPLIPEPITTPLDLPPADPFIPPPPPADVAPPPPFVSDEHRTDLPIVFLQEIPAPRPGDGTLGQPPSYDPFASSDSPPIPQIPPVAPSPFDKSFRWFRPYTMPISDPYHPSYYGGYTRDELLLSLQLQFEILSHRVLVLEFDESDRLSPFPFHPTSVPPPSSSAPFVPLPLAPTSFRTLMLVSLQLSSRSAF